ncbi:hypothetical protein M404DRAFT_847675 [Pisolithus tinctorius Marx 270]|uniref:Uncharacterized protein n=1 Tax=Pisolithus tinctorius Marx 270 TaxID=870435 RepID=A0A0C3NSN0_PISTI|nr:hypothetical protein M404DRAFT_847675 [Pisolithus tinctorius Marx 270]
MTSCNESKRNHSHSNSHCRIQHLNVGRSYLSMYSLLYSGLLLPHPLRPYMPLPRRVAVRIVKDIMARPMCIVYWVVALKRLLLHDLSLRANAYCCTLLRKTRRRREDDRWGSLGCNPRGLIL